MPELYYQKPKFFLLTIVIVVFLWLMTFFWQPLSFWVLKTLTVILLVFYTLKTRGRRAIPSQVKLKDFTWGIGSAIVLYLFFTVIYYFVSLFFPDLSAEMTEIYQLTADYNSLAIALLILFFIGPAEEIFWRGLIQQEFQEYFSLEKALWFTVLLYGVIHILTGNVILILANFAAGLFWAALFYWKQNLAMVIVGNALWKVLLLILSPLIL